MFNSQDSDFLVDEDFTVNVVEDESSDEVEDLIIEEIKVPGHPCSSQLKCECGCSITKPEAPSECDDLLVKIDPDTLKPRDKKLEKLQKLKERKKKQLEMKPIIQELKEIVMHGTTKSMLVCPTCKYSTKRASLFVTHLDAHLDFEKSFMCEHCDFVTFQKSHLSMHKARCSGATNKLRCPKCSFATIKYKHLHKHLRKHAVGFRRSCRQCSFKTRDEDELKDHVNKEHGSRYQCEECSFKTATKREYEKHVKSHKTKEVVSKRTLLKCDLCDYESFYKRNVLQHRISHLETE